MTEGLSTAQNGEPIRYSFGEKAGRYAYLALGIFAVGLCSFYAFNGYLMASLLPILFLLLHFTTWREMVRIYQGKALNIVLPLRNHAAQLAIIK